MYFVFGPGVVMLAAAAVSLIAGIYFLVKLFRTDWNMSINAFNAKFAHESSLGMSDMELDSKRRDIAKRLGVSAAMSTSAEFGGSVAASGQYASRSERSQESGIKTEVLDKTDVIRQTEVSRGESTEEL